MPPRTRRRSTSGTRNPKPSSACVTCSRGSRAPARRSVDDDAGKRGQALSAGEIEVDVVQTVRRRGVDHCVIHLRALIRRTDGPAPGSTAQLGNRRLESQLGRELAGKGVGDSCSPPRKEISGDAPPAACRNPARPWPPRETPSSLSRGFAPAYGAGAAHGERIAAPDRRQRSRRRRVSRRSPNLLVEASAHEARDALLHRRVALLHQRLAEHRELGGIGKEPAGEDLGRRHRQADELVPADDVPVARLGGGEDPRGFSPSSRSISRPPGVGEAIELGPSSAR